MPINIKIIPNFIGFFLFYVYFINIVESRYPKQEVILDISKSIVFLLMMSKNRNSTYILKISPSIHGNCHICFYSLTKNVILVLPLEV